MIFYAVPTETTEITEAETKKRIKQKQSTAGRVLSILGIVACILLIPILVLNMILIVQGFTADSSSIPNIGGVFPLMVQSGSMSGCIEEGDLIFSHTIDNKTSLQVDDIVTFWDDGAGSILVTHRIIDITTDDDGNVAYRTKGDANNASDARLVSSDDIVGVYDFRVPGLGNVAMFMQTIPGLIICVFVPLALFILYDIIRRRHIEKSERIETAALLEELKRLKKEAASAQAEQPAAAVAATTENAAEADPTDKEN